MLTEESLKQVKEEYVSLLKELSKGIEEKNGGIDALVEYLEESGFFTSPASSQYHCAFKGGLCLHSLNVYYQMVELCQYDNLRLKDKLNQFFIVALLHDIEKMFTYEECVKNEKVYSPNGSKSDNMGNYDWISTKGYKVREVSNRSIYGELGMGSYLIANKYLVLDTEIAIALTNYSCGIETSSSNKYTPQILDKHPLTALLHCADILSTYIEEKS